MSNSGRSRLREHAVTNLLQFPTLQQAAEATGIGLRTLQLWLKDDAFQELYRKAKADLLEGATTQLRVESRKMVEVLVKIAKDTKVNAAARVTAARSVLELALRAHEIEDLWQQIQELKQQSTTNAAV
jgi:hypothetical protein